VNDAVVGVLHPGEMGASVGQLLTHRGDVVLWASSKRSAATHRRAQGADFTDVGSVDELARRSAIVVSVCPPHGALDVARSVAGFEGLFVDMNAVSPATARQIAALIEAGGGQCVDGGIIGPPPRSTGSTRLYVSGPRADLVRDLFAGTVLRTRVISEDVGAASAVKVCYAAWTKGTVALLLAIRALSRAEQVEKASLEEWKESLPDLIERSLLAAGSAGAKGWRWIGEMEEIASTFAASDLPPGFHQAAAEIFRRAPRVDAVAADNATLDHMLARLGRHGDGRRQPL
jgi:hypothetical protein